MLPLTDDYNWLRAENWQEALREPEKLPEPIKEYLNEENAYYEQAMADTDELQKKLIAEMRGRIKEDDTIASSQGWPLCLSLEICEGVQSIQSIFARRAMAAMKKSSGCEQGS